ncbi:MAG: hypothetical protein M1837_005418 [Sclerophora amabilis]|nr:MAG: hypothetical protein M1837_005418 [Sclerophora amabilis]
MAITPYRWKSKSGVTRVIKGVQAESTHMKPVDHQTMEEEEAFIAEEELGRLSFVSTKVAE